MIGMARVDDGDEVVVEATHTETYNDIGLRSKLSHVPVDSKEYNSTS